MCFVKVSVNMSKTSIPVWTCSNLKKKATKNVKEFKKVFFVVLTLIIVTATWSWNIVVLNGWNASGVKEENLDCFDISGNQLPELNENEPELGSSIYFHETSCPKDTSDISLNARQACSAESALRAHPNTDVYLLISSPVFKRLEDTENVLVQQLLTYRNFKLRHIKFSEYLSNTPLKAIYMSGALNYSLWPVAHSSDVLRYATLYKFGGIYLDLDVIVLKPLTKLKNFAGAESNNSLGSGILGFGHDEVGRKVAAECAEELASTYNGKVWGFNGPGVITRVLKEKCKTHEIIKMLDSYCEGFRVYPIDYFSALSFNEPEYFFQEGHGEKMNKLFNRTYVIHYWNKISSKFILDKNLDIPFLKYARKYCPKIYEAANGNF